MAMRAPTRVLRKWESMTKFKGNAIRTLQEDKLFKKLREDDLHRFGTKQPIWMKETQRAVETFKREEEVPMHVKVDVQYNKSISQQRGPPIDLRGLEVTGLSPSVCRMLIRQKITSLTDVQMEMMRGIQKRTDLIVTSYTGSGKTFGLVLAVADRMLSQTGDLPYSFVVLLPTYPLCLQFQKWLSLFVGDSAARALVLNPGDRMEDLEVEVTQSRSLCVISTPEGYWKLLRNKKAIRDELFAEHQGAWRYHIPGDGIAFDLIKTNSQLLVVDEVDTMYRNDGVEVNGEVLSTLELLRHVLRIKGGLGNSNQQHYVPQQQVFFTTATLSQAVKRELELLCRTSTVARNGHDQDNLKRAVTMSKEYSITGMRRKREDMVEARHLAAFVQPFDADTFTFPPMLLHAWVLARSNKELAMSIKHVLDHYPTHGYDVPRLLLCGRAADIEQAKTLGKDVASHELVEEEDDDDDDDDDSNYRHARGEGDTTTTHPAESDDFTYTARGEARQSEEDNEEDDGFDAHHSAHTPRVPKAIVFVDDHLIQPMHGCIRDVVHIRCEVFAGSDARLRGIRRIYDEATSGIVLVIPKSSVRGLDFVDATHVFIIGAAECSATYIHLAGRTARNGAPGLCVNLFAPRHLQALRDRLRVVQLDVLPVDAPVLLGVAANARPLAAAVQTDANASRAHRDPKFAFRTARDVGAAQHVQKRMAQRSHHRR